MSAALQRSHSWHLCLRNPRGRVLAVAGYQILARGYAQRYMLPPARLSICPSVTRVLCGRICHASSRNFSNDINNDSCSSSAGSCINCCRHRRCSSTAACSNFLQLLQPLHFCCGTCDPATVSESSIVPRLPLQLPPLLLKQSLLLSALEVFKMLRAI